MSQWGHGYHTGKAEGHAEGVAEGGLIFGALAVGATLVGIKVYGEARNWLSARKTRRAQERAAAVKPTDEHPQVRPNEGTPTTP